MFKTRLLSGIVLVLVAFLTINCGGYVLLATLLCVSLIGMQELYRAMHVRKEGFGALELVSYAGVLLIYFLLIPGDPAYPLMGVIASLVLIMCVYVFCYPAYQAGQIMAAFFGIVYVGVMLSYIYQTRMLPGGQFHVWLIFLCSWGCDTCAYCVGVLIGKHKMAPVQPEKIHRRRSGRRSRSSAPRCHLCVFHQGRYGGVWNHLRCGRADLHGG